MGTLIERMLLLQCAIWVFVFAGMGILLPGVFGAPHGPEGYEAIRWQSGVGAAATAFMYATVRVYNTCKARRLGDSND